MNPWRLTILGAVAFASPPADDVALLQVGIVEHGLRSEEGMTAEAWLKKFEFFKNENLTLRWNLGGESAGASEGAEAAHEGVKAPAWYQALDRREAMTQMEAVKFGSFILKSTMSMVANTKKLGMGVPNVTDNQKRGYWISVVVSTAESLLLVANLVSGTHMCPVFDFLLWFVGGFLELTYSEGMAWYEAALVLAQQISTVGYGSNTPSAGAKLYTDLPVASAFVIFHSISSIFATVVLDPWWGRWKAAIACVLGAGEGWPGMMDFSVTDSTKNA